MEEPLDIVLRKSLRKGNKHRAPAISWHGKGFGLTQALS